MNACCLYDFRYSATSLSYENVISHLKGVAKHYVFQEEKGNTGYVHFQGRLSLIKKRRKMEALRLFSVPPEYFEPTTRKEFIKNSFQYQTKVDTRIAGPWTDKDIPIFIPRHIRGRTPYAWQQKILDCKTQYDERMINVLIDPIGNHGKSILASMVRQHKGITIPPIGDSKELVATCCDMLYPNNRDPGLILIDIPRSVNNKRLVSLMTAIETIKDGWVYDFRYKFKAHEFNRPQIWVMTNNPIERKYLSPDRFIFWAFNSENEMIPS